MKKYKTILVPLLIIIMLVLQACNLPNSAATEESIDPLVAAEMTITALASTNPQPSATVEVLPTFTELPTLSPTPENTATPAFTATPTFAYITLSEATNCRIGPGVAFDLVDTFLVGQTIEVIGKHPFENYWYVRSPNNPSLYCWMWGQYATGANLNNVPVLTPPPSPTPAPVPSFTLEYVNTGKCIGWFARFNVTNKGAVDFKSVSVSVKDTVTDETKTTTVNGFQGVDSCTLSAITPKLGPGEAYIITSSSPAITGLHKFSATVTLCTGENQGGTCVSQVVEYNP